MGYLIFGNGMGAGLILEGNVNSDTNDSEGEIGYIYIVGDGPVGLGKVGSFESAKSMG